jgi:hypothetical protein
LIYSTHPFIFGRRHEETVGETLRGYFHDGGSGVSGQYLDAVEEAAMHDPSTMFRGRSEGGEAFGVRKPAAALRSQPAGE